MKYGDIIFFEPINKKGELIAFLDGSPFSHVGLYFGEMDGVHLFIDSDLDGMRLRPLKPEWRNFVTKTPDTPMQEDLGMLVLEHYGQAYDYWHFFQLLLEKLTFGWYKVPKTDARHFICSELVNHVYGFMPDERATPATLWQFLSKK